ncbi:hypothetical protein [Nocardioides campestrisoli]|uniref:hypothetical protein n=1 Tax=Nocardioides campestrisoli TaxID=2736757 RepID=UPI0015E7C3BE|nr:hypothetical protein [Nocardioides campestrisoli]
MTAQLLTLIGGAWLGASLPHLWQMAISSEGIDMTSQGFAQVIGLILTIEIALLVGAGGEEYLAMSAVYRRHANRPTETVEELATPHHSYFKRIFGRDAAPRSRSATTSIPPTVAPQPDQM